MHGPADTTSGRGMLLFGAIMLVFALFLGFGRGAWRDASFFLGIAVFFGCYGAMVVDALPSLNRVLLIVGLASGLVAFCLALLAANGGS